MTWRLNRARRFGRGMRGEHRGNAGFPRAGHRGRECGTAGGDVRTPDQCAEPLASRGWTAGDTAALRGRRAPAARPARAARARSAGCAARRRARSPTASGRWRCAARRRSASPPRTGWRSRRERHGRREAADAAARRTRPTAVNLRWALDRGARRAPRPALAAARAAASPSRSAADLRLIAEHGAALLGDGASGCSRTATPARSPRAATAPPLGVLRRAWRAGRVARGLGRRDAAAAPGRAPDGVGAASARASRTASSPTRAPAPLMSRGLVDRVVVGADRIAANGDMANKIGTYPLAVAGRAPRRARSTSRRRCRRSIRHARPARTSRSRSATPRRWRARRRRGGRTRRST